MDVMEAIQKRRSIRKYKADTVPGDLIEKLLEAARLAPSASNVQSWRFKVITDEKVRKELQEAAHGQKFVGQAPVIMACCIDVSTFKDTTRRAMELVRTGAVRPSLGMTLLYLRKEEDAEKESRQLLHGVMNVTIAVEQMILAATEMGLGTCWIRAFNEEEATRVLDLPDDVILLALLTVGYPDEDPKPRPRRSRDEIRI